MKILMFSINPLYPDKIIGGSTRHLQDVAVYLAEQGHDVTVLCTRREDNQAPFDWHSRIRVKPLLPFKQPFPQPYDIAPYDMALIIRIVLEHLAEADRFYVHDGELLFPEVLAVKPTVVSLRDNAYPESRLGSFLFRADALIVLSDYAKQVCLATAGQFRPGLKDRLVVIPNTPDSAMRGPGEPSRKIFQLTGVAPGDGPILLHPHRPEPGKGLPQTIAVVERLVRRGGYPRLKVLVPEWFDEAISPDAKAFMDKTRCEIVSRGLQDYFYFHPWVPRDDMPDYYRLGHLTLALGHIVEAFGNAPYESLACGTPAIVARVGPHRSLVPDQYLPKVSFDDHDAAAECAHAFLSGQRILASGTADYFCRTFDRQQQLRNYAEVILKTPHQPTLDWDNEAFLKSATYRLAPWCDFINGKIYHDFRASYYNDDVLIGLLRTCPHEITEEHLRSRGISGEQRDAWAREGLLTRN